MHNWEKDKNNRRVTRLSNTVHGRIYHHCFRHFLIDLPLLAPDFLVHGSCIASAFLRNFTFQTKLLFFGKGNDTSFTNRKILIYPPLSVVNRV